MLVVQSRRNCSLAQVCRLSHIPGEFVLTRRFHSTALMLGVPAQVAGCKNITLATPPRPDGSISPEIIYIAQLIGAKTVVKAGGAHAIAAMAYGTKSVPKADKLYGPGNQFVTAAKMVRSAVLPRIRGVR